MNEVMVRLESQMRALKLKGMLGYYREFSERAAQGKLQYEEYLSLLLEEELRGKTERSIKTKVHKARFPFIKTLEAFDFSFQPGLGEKEILKLSSLDFIEKKENLIFLGPPGVGKTHLAVAFGIKACSAKYRVLFMTAQKLIEDLMLSVRAGTITSKLLAYSRLNLLIIDELGYMPITKEQANLLFQLVSIRYEKGSIILTSNYNFEEWGQVFQDNVVAAAIIDRMVHHARIFYINGSSYRLKSKLEKKRN
ncbi:MAG: IS21-like element helper ATPase IstB [Candidatus Methanomethylicaceae archaeon]